MGSSSSSLKRRDSLDSLFSSSSVQSPSAAYGRLRIDSPRQHHRHGGLSPAGTPNSLFHRRPFRNLSHDNLVLQQQGEVSLVGRPSPPTETSSLLLASSQRQSSGQSPRELKGSHHHGHGASMTDDVFKTHHVVGSPPLAVWIVPALLCALAYAFYNIFIKKGSATIHPVLGGVILQFVAALLGILLLGFIIIRDGGNMDELDWDWEGVQWSVRAGIAVGLAEMISFFVSSLGVQAMQSIPILIGGSVMFGTILGLCLLGEVLSYHGWLGVFLLILGICLVATDPAATNHHGH